MKWTARHAPLPTHSSTSRPVRAFSSARCFASSRGRSSRAASPMRYRASTGAGAVDQRTKMAERDNPATPRTAMTFFMERSFLFWGMNGAKNPVTETGYRIFRGDPAGIRTPDPLLKRQLLCRLSYRVRMPCASSGKEMAGTAGFEPAGEGVKVPCLTTWRRPNGKRRGDRGNPDPLCPVWGG